jgi:hypothetical protein
MGTPSSPAPDALAKPPVIALPKPKKGMRAHPVTVVIALAALGTAMWGAYARAGNTDDLNWVPEASGVFFGGVLVAIALGLIGYFAAGRSALVLNIVVSLMLGLQIAGNALSIPIARRVQDRARADAAIKRMNDLQQELHAQQQKQMEEQGYVSLTPQKAEELRGRMDAAVSDLRGEDAVVGRAVNKMTKDMMAAAGPVGQAMTTLIEKGGLQIPTLKTKQDIEERLALNATLLEANATFRDAIRAGPLEFHKALVAGGISEAAAAQHVAGYQSGAKLPLLLQLCDCRDKLGEANKEYLTILHDQWGKWTEKGGRVAFQDRSVVNAFTSAARRIGEAADDEDKVMAAMGLKQQKTANAETNK